MSPEPYTQTMILTAPGQPTDIDGVLAERESRYGAFCDHAALTQSMKELMWATPKWSGLSASQREALEMIAHKVGRILCGDPQYVDSWLDISGYATLIVNELKV